jgi:Arc/MetJ-type ribon-helix-helix transcriptional regulator
MVMVQKRTHVFLPEGLITDIDQLVGKGKRSKFLTEIVEREVRKQKLLRAIDEAAGCRKSEDHPELKNGSAAWVKALRTGGEARLPKDG